MPSFGHVGHPNATMEAPSAEQPATVPHAGVPGAPEGSQHPTSPKGGRPRQGYLGGLDGLRAIAVTAVIIFHLDPTWLPGGFLGVDVFFVISGFLITTLLIRERRDSGRVDLPAFWIRRARRLLPALFVVVPVSIIIARTVEADLLVGVVRQTLGALTFSTNWVEIFAGSNYFESTSPQLFMNFWSLAVEEQFYLFWPMVTLVMLAVHRRTGLKEGVLAGLVLGIGLASAVHMALTFSPDNPTRAYYGTDTHLVGLMLGASLALLWTGPGRAFTVTRFWRRWRPLLLLGAVVTLSALLVLAGEERQWTFQVGIPLASLATAIIMLGGVDRPGKLRTLLELPPMKWIGQRSYGIYLWHWPVILIVSATFPATSGTSDFLWTRLWAVVVTLALADLSFHFIETPVRKRGFRATGRRVWSAVTFRSRAGAGVVVGLAASLAAVLVAIMVTAPDSSTTQQTIERNAAAASAPRETTPAPTFTGTKSFTMPEGEEIDIFGDSMVVGSVPALQYYFPGVQIDAKSNRQWSDGLAAIQAADDSLRRAVVLAFGTNAGTDPETIEKIIDEIGPNRMVVLVNLHADRLSRIEEDNAELARIAEEHDNVAIADWDSTVTAEDLQADGIHPSLGGAHTYAATIRQAFADLTYKHTGKKPKLEELPKPEQ